MGGKHHAPPDYRPREFALPDNGCWERCLAEVGRRFGVEAEPACRVVRIFYDTFDWRLHRRGQILYTERRGRDPVMRLMWRDTRGGGSTSQPVSEPPGFAAALPPRLRSRLGAVIEPRALLAVVELRGPVSRASVLDSDAKTVARLEEAVWTVYADGRPRGRLAARVTLEALRGYAAAAAEAAQALAGGGAHRQGEAVLTAALAHIERFPGDYSSKFALQLDPTHTAQQATLVLLKHLAQTMRRNEQGTMAATDPEFLHDFRVAVRRTRSLLAQAKGVLRAQAPFRAEFAWLARQTSEPRDLDVQLLELKEINSAALAPLISHLRARRRRARARLNRTLAGERYRKLLDNWVRLLDAADMAPGPLAEQPVSAYAGERIWRIYRRAIREGHAIHAESRAEALHELRKTCKQLRYLMEAYQSLYPARLISGRIKELRRLQDYLGGFQDQNVQRENLRRSGRELAANNAGDAEILMEIGKMLERLRVEQNITRKEFGDRFAAFAGNRRAFARLFKS